MHIPRFPLLLAVAAVSVAACGDGESSPSADAPDARPTVVVTTNILGDVVEAVAGDQVDVVTVMPVGADPHEFQASAREVDQMRSAGALVFNGGGFEEGLVDVIDAAREDGVSVFEALGAVEPIEGAADDHEDHGDDDDEHDHEHDHDQDPHFFTDPVRMSAAVDALAVFLVAEVDGIDSDRLRTSTDAYLAELAALDADVEATLASVPADRRVLVTTHDVFGAFADRYGFEVIGTLIPGGSTADGASAGELAELADRIDEAGVPAVFTDSSSSERLAGTLADEVGGVEVVALFSESLGDAGSGGATYLDMVRTNAARIAAALG